MLVFVSHRHGVATGTVARLVAELRRQLGEGSVFLDIDTIDPGQLFRGRILQEIAKCSVLLVAIDEDWSTERLFEAGDYVRFEVETALMRDDVVIVPVLIGRGTLPRREALPGSIASLLDRNAFRIDPHRLERDVDKLARHIRRAAGEGSPAATTGTPLMGRFKWGMVGIATLLIGGTVASQCGDGHGVWVVGQGNKTSVNKGVIDESVKIYQDAPKSPGAGGTSSPAIHSLKVPAEVSEP